MTSRRDAEREREVLRERERATRTARETLPTAPRTNEYFVPKDGIDREVITADICRYLGNDALVRPGAYENPQTRQIQQGYFINAYRNLTSAMIQDLKTDSARWEEERRQAAARNPAGGISSRDANGNARMSNPPAVDYASSSTRQSRQNYGPSEGIPPNSGVGKYPLSAPGQSQSAYDGSSYPPGYGQAAPQYPPTSVYGTSDVPNYHHEANIKVERLPQGVAGSMNVTRSSPSYNPPHTGYSNQPDPRGAYYSGGPPAGPPPAAYPSPQQQQQQPDSHYYDYPGPNSAYDSRDQYNSMYSPGSISSIPGGAPAQAGLRRERERVDDRDRLGYRRR